MSKEKEELKEELTPQEEMKEAAVNQEAVGNDTATGECADEAKQASEEERLAAEVEKKEAEVADLKDKYLRLSAEFDNYRKRTMKEKAELILNGAEKCITSLLPVVDDFERALKNMETATDVAAVKEGVDLIYKKVMSTLEQNGVKVIDAVDKALDTDFHEAVAVVPVPDEQKKGKIIDCVQTGYTLNEKVIRHSKVVVAE